MRSSARLTATPCSSRTLPAALASRAPNGLRSSASAALRRRSAAHTPDAGTCHDGGCGVARTWSSKRTTAAMAADSHVTWVHRRQKCECHFSKKKLAGTTRGGYPMSSLALVWLESVATSEVQSCAEPTLNVWYETNFSSGPSDSVLPPANPAQHLASCSNRRRAAAHASNTYPRSPSKNRSTSHLLRPHGHGPLTPAARRPRGAARPPVAVRPRT